MPDPMNATRWGVRAVDGGFVRLYVNGQLFDFAPRAAADLAETIRVILGIEKPAPVAPETPGDTPVGAETPRRRPPMSDLLRLSNFPENGPPERRDGNADVSFQDVPYLVVPALTQKPIVHLAVECTGVEWHMNSSVRIYARTRCGREVYADRRSMCWSAPCKRCFPRETTPDAPKGGED